MRPLFDNLPVIYNQHLVCIPDRSETVGDNKAGPPFHEPQKRLLDMCLSAGVYTACRFIQDQYARVCQDGPGYGKELPLPLTEVAGTFIELCLIAMGQLTDEIIGICHPGCTHNLFIGCIQPSVTDILYNCVGKEEGVLQY